LAEILVIKLGALGDLILAEGALRDLRAHHRHDRITLMTAPAYRAVMARCPWLDDILADPRAPRWRLDQMWRLRRRLHAGRFAMVYDLQNSGRTHWYYRHLFPRGPWSGTAPGCSHPLPAGDTSLGTARHARQLATAGVPVQFARQPDLGWMAAEVDDLLATAGVRRPYAVLVPGSSARNQDKRWPHYAELAARLDAAGWLPVTVPGPDEAEADPLPGVALRHGDGRWLDLFELAGVLRKAALVVGNDTGPTHMAAFLGVPGVALFGARRATIKGSLAAVGFGVLSRQRLAELTVDEVMAALPLARAA
jgi:ADP-heptose:LPS heptosyltransferase